METGILTGASVAIAGDCWAGVVRPSSSAALAPPLAEAARTAPTKTSVLLDRDPAIDRPDRRDRLFDSAKRKQDGMNVQILARSARPLGASPVLPGAVHDIRAPWITASSTRSRKPTSSAGPTKGTGAPGTLRVPWWCSWDFPSSCQRAVSRSHANIRALAEQAVATLKLWARFNKPRCSITCITSLS